jgi:hypothetical protein
MADRANPSPRAREASIPSPNFFPFLPTRLELVYLNDISGQRRRREFVFRIYPSSPFPDPWFDILDDLNLRFGEGLEGLGESRNIGGINPPIEAKDLQTVLKENELDTECTICLEVLESLTAARLLCNHLFCYECIRRWLSDNTQCPMCRREVCPREYKREEQHQNPVFMTSDVEDVD